MDWTVAIQKAKLFIAPLTVQQKVALATGVGWGNGPCVGNTPAVGGFGGYCLQDSPTGVRFANGVSAFPAGINVAQTWNLSLIYERAAAQGYEFRNKGVNVALTPMMNLARVPLGGRNWEGFSADPWLSAEAAAQSVIGLQSQGVIATAKHFILNEQEHFRTTSSSNIDDRTLHELYGLPFMRAVEAGAGSIMCSYNQVNNVYACQNNRTLNQILKGEWAFQGFVQSDWSATMSGVPSVLAGLDMTMPGDITFGSGTSYFGQNLTNAVNSGQVSTARLDDMAVRIMAPYYLLGQDQGYPPVDLNSFNPSENSNKSVQANHKDVIRRIGAESNVLLKNVGGMLPIPSKQGLTIALIGTDAGPSPGGPNSCPDHGCDQGTLAQGWGSGTCNFPYLIDPLQAMEAKAATVGQKVLSSLNDYDQTTAKQLAQQADIAIVFGNADSGEGYITVEGNQGDRNDFNVWHNISSMIDAVASVNKNIIVVLHAVGPVMMPWIDNPSVKAVVYASLPGQESGNALVDVLYGDVNPSGKLVHTIAKQPTDYPAAVVYTKTTPIAQINYTEGLYIDYRWFDAKKIAPLFEFGFGLSYTNFTYSNLVILPIDTVGSPYVSLSNDTLLYEINVEITNSGSVAGAEVAQLYLVHPAENNEPPQILRGFDKVFLQPQEIGIVTFYLSAIDISVWDTIAQLWRLSTNPYGINVGASSRDIRLNGVFKPVIVS